MSAILNINCYYIESSHPSVAANEVQPLHHGTPQLDPLLCIIKEV